MPLCPFTSRPSFKAGFHLASSLPTIEHNHDLVDLTGPDQPEDDIGDKDPPLQEAALTETKPQKRRGRPPGRGKPAAGAMPIPTPMFLEHPARRSIGTAAIGVSNLRKDDKAAAQLVPISLGISALTISDQTSDLHGFSFDLETTGFMSDKCRIVDIAVVDVETGRCAC